MITRASLVELVKDGAPGRRERARRGPNAEGLRRCINHGRAVAAPIDCAQVCDFTDAEKEQAQREIDEDKKKRLEMQADMGKFLLLLGFGMLYYFWVSYDVVPPIIDRAAQLLGFARFARVGDLKAMFSGGQEL